MNWSEFWDKVWSALTSGGIVLLKLFAIFIVGYILIRVIKKITKKLLAKTSLDDLFKKYIIKALSFVLYVLLVLTMLQTIGVEVTGIVAAIAAAGLAVALALQDALKSLANGIIILITKPFKANDAIEVNGISGKVVSVSFFNTIIDTWDNKRIIIPNKNMINYEIENTNYHGTRRMSFEFTVSHNTDIELLRKLVIESFLSNEKVFTEPAPELLLREINETGIKFEARAWTVSDDLAGVLPNCMQVIYNEIKKNGIELASKSLVVYNEERNKNLFYDNKPLAFRDLTQNPEIKNSEDASLDKQIENFAFGRIKKIKSKKNNKT